MPPTTSKMTSLQSVSQSVTHSLALALILIFSFARLLIHCKMPLTHLLTFHSLACSISRWLTRSFAHSLNRRFRFLNLSLYKNVCAKMDKQPDSACLSPDILLRILHSVRY